MQEATSPCVVFCHTLSQLLLLYFISNISHNFFHYQTLSMLAKRSPSSSQTCCLLLEPPVLSWRRLDPTVLCRNRANCRRLRLCLRWHHTHKPRTITPPTHSATPKSLNGSTGTSTIPGS